MHRWRRKKKKRSATKWSGMMNLLNTGDTCFLRNTLHARWVCSHGKQEEKNKNECSWDKKKGDKRKKRGPWINPSAHLSGWAFPCRFTTTRVIFGDAVASGPGFLNWGKDRAASSLIRSDSFAHAGNTRIKSACWEVSCWNSAYLRIVEIPTSTRLRNFI